MSTKTTYIQTELGLIPEDWEVKKLGECSSISGDYGINAPAVKFSEDLPTYLRITDIDDDGNYSKENKVSVKDDNSESFILDDEDIVFARTGATVGKTYLHNKKENGDLVFAGFLIRFRTNFDILLPYYLKLYTNTDKYWNWVSVFSMRSGQPGINSKEYSNLKIPLPPLPEQKAIADCISTWDNAIEKQSQLIELHTQRKKALMQKLLTGKKRLPGFSGEWNLNSINDLFIFKNGKAHENDIDENGKYILVNSKFISTDGEILKKTNSNLAPLEVNDLVFVMSDVPNGKALAKFFLIKEDNLYTLNQRIGLLKIKKGNPIFMYYLLNRNAYFLMFDNGVGQTNLRKDDILDCPLNIPSLSEQNAIAEILATADRELQLQKDKLAQLQTQKKGLMQVLLTGKKRLIN